MSDRLKRPRETMSDTIQQALDEAQLMPDFLARPNSKKA